MYIQNNLYVLACKHFVYPLKVAVKQCKKCYKKNGITSHIEKEAFLSNTLNVVCTEKLG